MATEGDADRTRQERAEAILSALEGDEVDAVVGRRGVALLRLREVEEQLRKTEAVSKRRLEEIETIYRSAPVGLCVLDRDLRFVRVNEHLAENNGMPVDDHLGRRIGEVLPGADAVERRVRRVIETGEAITGLEVSGQTPARSGVERFWLEHLLPLRDEAGEVVGVNVVIQEITESKRRERELRDSHQQLEHRVQERTGELEDTVRKLQTEIARRELAEGAMRDRSEKLQELNRELARRAHQLQALAMELSTAEDRERHRVAEILHDDLQQVLVGARYQFDTFVKCLGDGPADPETFRPIAELLAEAIRKSRTLAHELSPPALRQKGLSSALCWLGEQMRTQHSLAVELTVQGDAEPRSEPIKRFLYRAVGELLFNVVKHAGVDEARVSLRREPDGLVITVTDEGAGFETSEAFADGGGFGLFSIHERLELLGGRLVIRSAPGKGSTFVLHVPASADEPKGHGAPADKDGRTPASKPRARAPVDGDGDGHDPGRTSVLLVDDHRVMREGLAVLLHNEPTVEVVGEADNGKQAVDLVGALSPDVVLMDVSMPVMNGIDATITIKREWPDVRVIALSMFDQPDLIGEMLDAGAEAYFTKSGPADDLLDAIKRDPPA
jgi:PAS domain S-box-containing protein